MILKRSQDLINSFLNINRRIHIHLGLFLLLFIWLFSISGLLINHGSWKFASFYEQRKERIIDFTLPVSSLSGNPALVAQILTQLKISGEVENSKITLESIDFRVQSPGIVRDIHLDSKNGSGTIREMKYNFWGKLKTLHAFNGLNKNDPAKSPNWIITNVWRLSMDLIAIILIVLCLTSWLMWYKVRRDYRLGFIMFGIGCVVSGYYIFLVDYL